MKKVFVNVPLSQSSVSLRLADIQKRCSQLLDAPGDFTGLSLEESTSEFKTNNHNPYDRG